MTLDVLRDAWRARAPLDGRSFMLACRAAAVPLAVVFSASSGGTDALPQLLGVLLGLVGGILADLRPHGDRTQVLAAVADCLVVAGAATVAPIAPFGSYSPLGVLLVVGWATRRGGWFGATVGAAMSLPIAAWYLLVPDAVDVGAVVGPVGTMPPMGLLVGWAAQRQTAAQQRIAEQAARLELARVELERYAGRVSHDLKNPLDALIGYARLLVADGAQPELAGRVLRCATDMAAQVEGLYVTSVDPTAPLRSETVDVVELVLDAGDDVDAGRGLLRLDVGDVPGVDADPRLLRLVALNLLSNAVTHGRAASGPVRVTVTGRQRDDGRVELEVGDDGVGIAAGQRDAALEHGRRGSLSGGSGLGLGTVAAVVARHGGTVALDDSAAGGLLVRLDLPAG